jgi:hypothetical protein
MSYGSSPDTSRAQEEAGEAHAEDGEIVSFTMVREIRWIKV